MTLLLLSLFASAFFSGMEMAFVSANRLQAELDMNQGGRGSKIVMHLLGRPERFITTMLVGNNLALVLFGLQSAILISGWLFGVERWEDTPSPFLALTVQTLIATATVLVLAEFLPKSIFQVRSNKWLRWLSFPLLIVHYALLFPAVIVLGLSRLVVARGEDEGAGDQLGAVDLEYYIRELNDRPEADAELDLNNELEILQNALDLPDVKARDCLVPRNEIVAVEVDEELVVLEALFASTGLSKIVVYQEDIDQIIGYVHTKDLFQNPAEIRSILHPTFIVPEPMAADEIMKEFIRRKRHLAVVVDEFGGTSGILTTEDIVEELIGEIEDEHDSDLLTERELGAGHFIFSARLEIDALNKRHALGLPKEEDYETLGGLIIHHAQLIPEVGHVLQLGDSTLIVTSVLGHRIDTIELYKSRG
jgi:CBS domain containing-hemolysin-like protein|tara:strand:+ start:237 stop:1496 length:1260 start_codon:yes stop_codon:yes gene_type:complete